MAVQNVSTQGAPAQRNTNATAANAQGTAKSAAVEKTASPAPSAPNTTDASKQIAAGVQLSPRAKEMSLAKKVIDNTPDIREEKVTKFKDLIAKGQYKPDANKITEGIVREAIRDDLSKNPDALLNE